jgi:peptide/nickel transport system permease protein
MLAYITKRLGLAVLVALTVSILAFMLLYLSGDPALAIAGEGARQVDIDMVRKTYGFDQLAAQGRPRRSWSVHLFQNRGGHADFY